MRLFVGPRFVICWIVAGALVGPPAGGQSKPRPSPQWQASNLFSSVGVLVQGNRVACGLVNTGQICVGYTSSPIGGGAFWPQVTSDQYIFYSGPQIAGIIPPSAGFAWAGDTVGTFIASTRGWKHGEGRTLVFDSRNPDDLAQWPNGAVIRDPNVYAPLLIGRNTAADQDLWLRYWDGNPGLLSGRTHPMGILVEQRALAWNFPSGNEDIIYFVLTLTNVSASDPAVYANATIPAAVQTEIAAMGAQFQQLNEAQLGVAIPDGGYALEQVYFGLWTDFDIAVFSDNYSTISLPFRTAFSYSGRFQPEVGWTFPPEVFGAAPFAALPGFVGTKFIRAPADLAMFTTFTGNPTGFPYPSDVNQLWRYLSGYFGSTDMPCNIASNAAIARARRVCFVKSFQSDDRYSQSIGPFQLAPGESQTVVLTYLFAAPLDTAVTYSGGNLPPGFPFPGDSIFQDTTKIRAVERIAGWRAQADANGNSIIEEHEVVTVPRSLLHRAQLAQAFADNKFRLPEPPAQPGFFLIPGNRQVTIVWQRSASETTGDPYFAIAADPTTPLYDPSFRQYDVEGYRLYRGHSPNALTLIAQFDYQGTVMVDYTGTFHYSGRCAPELGSFADCPVAFPATPDPAVFAEHELAGWFVQVPAGARIVSGTGALVVLRTDTATIGSGWQGGQLSDEGVPFAYVDTGRTNSFPLYYAVTAFDVNSFRSGPSSLESPRLVKSVTPRISAGQETGGAVAIEMLSAAGTPLDSGAPLPTIDPATGIFTGPMPPTNGMAVRLHSFLPQVVGAGSITVTLDSVIPGMAELDVMPGRSRPTLYYFTRDGSGGQAPGAFTIGLEQDDHDGMRTTAAPFDGIAAVTGQAARFGGDSTFSLFGETGLTSVGTWRLTSFGRANSNALPGNSAFNGPRWWAGTGNENTPNPNGGLCGPASPGACGSTVAVPNLSLTAGNIPGVAIFHVQAYSSVPNAPMRNLEPLLASVVRAADFRVFWGSAGTIDSVIDRTHGVRVPFHPAIRASWGILNQASFAVTDQALTRDSNNALLTWADIFCVDPSPTTMSSVNNGNCGGTAQTPAVLQNGAALSPMAFASSSYADTDTLSATGTGFIFYLNGHFFLMQTATLPPQGTVWNARFYSGNVTGSAAGANFAFQPAVRPPPVPGLRVRVTYQGSALNALAVTDSQLARIHTVPDPLYVASAYMTTPDTAVLRFVNLPSRAIIRIYSTSGILVQVLPHDDPTDGGEAVWNLRNRNGRWVASGVYFYHIETPAGRSRVGRFTVITNAPLR